MHSDREVVQLQNDRNRLETRPGYLVYDGDPWRISAASASGFPAVDRLVMTLMQSVMAVRFSQPESMSNTGR